MTKGTKHRVTVTLSEETAQKIEAIAMKRSTTISELVAEKIAEAYEQLSSRER